MPGDVNPISHASTINTAFSYCAASSLWYKETDTYKHSPMVGIMADGIPIYGPRGGNGSAPVDIDECGGHVTDLPFYHYHFRSTFPYSVKCLKGCLDGNVDSDLQASCLVNSTATAASNYSSIANMTYTYGGSGVNSTDWSGPACLLIFGFIIFIPGMLCCICMMCGKRITKWHGAKKEENDEDEAYHSSDDDDDDFEWISDDEDITDVDRLRAAGLLS
jgi:hypothetical protein